MLKKIKLNLTSKYEEAIAAYHLAEMVVGFSQGREHILNIGAEQGDILKWDDLVLLITPTHFKHIQIKSQFSNFAEDPTTRDTYTKGKRNGQLRDLNPFDETLESLANWSRTINPMTITPKHSFEFCIPVITLTIKQNLTAKNLSDLITVHIKPQTTATDLIALQKTDTSVQRCFEYLTSWCSFADWDHVLKVFRLLNFRQCGTETDLNTQTENILKQSFTDPKEVREKIVGYLKDNTTFVGAISPRPLLFLIKDKLLPSAQLWTQIEKIGTQWEISGIQDLSEVDKTERAEVIVPELWKNDRQRHLKILIPPTESCLLLNNLIHLAIHLKGQVSTHAEHKELWSNEMTKKVGGTLGTSSSDCDDFAVVENNAKFKASDPQKINNLTERDNYANAISKNIFNSTWDLAVDSLEKKISSENATELRNAIFQRWTAWKTKLNADEKQRALLLTDLVHPTAEGTDILGALRIGPKTVPMIRDGLYLLLVISVALSKDDNVWNELTPDFSTKLIGIEYWSGSSGKARKVKSLVEDKDVLELVGKESCKILILSGVKANKEDIYGYSLADGKEQSPNIGTPYRPKLLLTFNPKMMKLINEGKIESINKLLTEMLSEDSAAKTNATNFTI